MNNIDDVYASDMQEKLKFQLLSLLPCNYNSIWIDEVFCSSQQ
jgi:hypothetical protein